LGEVIRLTSAEALQPSVVHITGPLIRILGDRFNWNVKAAVLETLALLLAKVHTCFLNTLKFLFDGSLREWYSCHEFSSFGNEICGQI
jgi:hypothetical protein